MRLLTKIVSVWRIEVVWNKSLLLLMMFCIDSSFIACRWPAPGVSFILNSVVTWPRREIQSLFIKEKRNRVWYRHYVYFEIYAAWVGGASYIHFSRQYKTRVFRYRFFFTCYDRFLYQNRHRFIHYDIWRKISSQKYTFKRYPTTSTVRSYPLPPPPRPPDGIVLLLANSHNPAITTHAQALVTLTK